MNSNLENDSLEKHVLVMFFYSSNAWAGAFFCGNVLELVKKKKLLEESQDFIKWTEFKDNFNQIEVYIEKDLIPEIEQNEEMFIDAFITNMKGKDKGFFFIKNKNNDVYRF